MKQRVPTALTLALGLVLGFLGCGFVNWRWPLPTAPLVIERCSDDSERALWDLLLQGDPVTTAPPNTSLQTREF